MCAIDGRIGVERHERWGIDRRPSVLACSGNVKPPDRTFDNPLHAHLPEGHEQFNKVTAPGGPPDLAVPQLKHIAKAVSINQPRQELIELLYELEPAVHHSGLKTKAAKKDEKNVLYRLA
ncbi:MAG TPA: hypothetical protein EYP14_03100, partial [Planctomycetaceae bacterium]|nr:hypothetical protein [Planctomycetaceae bacterium]